MTAVLPRPAGAGTPDRSEAVLPRLAGAGGPDRAEVGFRRVEPADLEAVRAFLAGLSLDSAYRRFFTGIGSPSSTLVRRLVEVDHQRRSAVLALAGGEVIGMADTAVLADDVTVELGVVVADAWQRKGIGPRLVAAALAPAAARGCTTLLVYTLPDNARVARMLRRRWPGAGPARDGDCLVWTLPLPR